MDERFPVFSVVEEGDEIVVQTDSALPARLPFGVVSSVVAAAVVWFGLTALGVALSFQVLEFRWWFVVVGVVLFLVALVFNSNIIESVEALYGQYSASARVAGVAAYLGIGAGGVGTVLALRPDSGWGVVPLVIGAGCLTRAPFAISGARNALRYARGRQAVIRRVRQYGRRAPGVITGVRFRQRWQQGYPEFFVDVVCGLGSVTANMVTRSERVPVAGSTVAVTHEGVMGTMLVELGAGARFETDANRYREPAE